MLEEICKEQGATRSTLQAKIEMLKNNGVSPGIISALDETRVVGNAGIHDALAFSADEIEEVCLVLYVQPAERARMAAKRQARIDAHKAAQP
ncbi:DUF4145 domain-containing protein [Kitasatospora sp. NPDC088391]|uniref:DUF4145 domain-containing protein n=1 Tax=Kitasatospora sp. NPDC088391 TaxID=3364074 RepID=UPI00381418FC